MGMSEASANCKTCNKPVMARRIGTSVILHVLLTLITGGLWLPIWIIIFIINEIKGGWRCTQCGSRVWLVR